MTITLPFFFFFPRVATPLTIRVQTEGYFPKTVIDSLFLLYFC